MCVYGLDWEFPEWGGAAGARQSVVVFCLCGCGGGKAVATTHRCAFILSHNSKRVMSESMQDELAASIDDVENLIPFRTPGIYLFTGTCMFYALVPQGCG